jgi:hypothetical protein
MISELSEIPGFQERWASIPLEQDNEPSLLGAPEEIVTDAGNYRVFSSRIYFPPFYYLREYVPTEGGSSEALQGLRAKGAAVAHFDPVLHWNLH